MADTDKQVMVKQRKPNKTDSNTSLVTPMNIVSKPYY